MAASFSPTQYNSFATNYDTLNDLPVSRAIVINAKRILSPFIKGARVLELACGSGFFTGHLLDWGASSVVAVDISQGMVDVAKKEIAKRLSVSLMLSPREKQNSTLSLRRGC